MRKVLFFAFLAALPAALAGCSDGGTDDGSNAGSGASSSMTTTGPPPKPVVYSDTLHLLAPPEMALALPDGSSEISTPTDQGFGPGGGAGQGGPQAQWTYRVAGNSNVTGAEAHVWIEITDNLFQPVDPRDPQETCTWLVSLALGGDADPAFGCLSEPPGVIAPGTKELVFDLLALDAEMETNETITLTFRRNAFSASPENSVFVLSGSAEHDSRVVLKGLEEPVPEA